jgi:hypothetical protein
LALHATSTPAFLPGLDAISSASPLTHIPDWRLHSDGLRIGILYGRAQGRKPHRAP